jgi:hypothetical protein
VFWIFAILLGLAQTAPTGTIVGVAKLSDNSKPVPRARVVLLTPKYIETWDRQVQTRLDNYWELFKPEFVAKKETFIEFENAARLEAFRYVTSEMRRELGDGASKLMKDASATGQFEFDGVPFGTYQLLVQADVNGQEIVWSKPVVVQSALPIFIDITKPVS